MKIKISAARRQYTANISEFMLERYRLGECEEEDKQTVEKALAEDGNLRSELKQLEESDRELLQRYPDLFFGLRNIPGTDYKGSSNRRFPKHEQTGAGKRRLFTLIAAALLAGIIFPALHFLYNGAVNSSGAEDLFGDRAKGNSLKGTELYVYLKGEEKNPLADQAVLREGSTVQLAYTTPPDNEYYGVIFSIDGRSLVTMHYPYRKGQSSLLVSGKVTFLDEAYILDDAPDYEIFIFVVSENPLDAEAVLEEAQAIAGEIKKPDTRFLKEKSKMAFRDCEVETVTALKK